MQSWVFLIHLDDFKDIRLYYKKDYNIVMVQLQISAETMGRMEKISGISHARDGDFLVNQTIDILEKKIREG